MINDIKKIKKHIKYKWVKTVRLNLLQKINQQQKHRPLCTSWITFNDY